MATWTLRFRAEPGEAGNLRVKVYTQDRQTLLATINTTVEEVTGSYSCQISDALTGTWYVSVTLIDTGELTADGFASPAQLEVQDTLTTAASGESIASSVISGLSAIEPKVVRNYDPRTRHIRFTARDVLSAALGTQVDIPVNLPSGIDGNECTAVFGAEKADDPTEKVNAAAELVELGSIWHVRVELTSSQSALEPGDYDYSAIVLDNSSQQVTIAGGHLEIAKSYASPVS